jgi:CBS domain-containing protein
MAQSVAMTDQKRPSDTTEALTRRELRSEKLKAVGRREPAIVGPETSIGDAVERMQRNGGEALLICDGERLLGILTERDVMLKVLARGVDMDSSVDRFMTARPDTLTSDATIEDALRLMERGGYRTIPLAEPDGKVVGVLRQQDIVEFVAEAFPQEILNLPPRPHQVADQAEGG